MWNQASNIKKKLKAKPTLFTSAQNKYFATPTLNDILLFQLLKGTKKSYKICRHCNFVHSTFFSLLSVEMLSVHTQSETAMKFIAHLIHFHVYEIIR